MVKVAKLLHPGVRPHHPPDVCVRINKDWIPLLWTALAPMEYQSMWQVGTDWPQAQLDYYELMQIFREALEECQEDVCYNFKPFDTVFSFAPDSPFDVGAPPAPGYPNRSWYVVGTPVLGGTEPGDVLTDLLHFPATLTEVLDVVTQSGFPRFTLTVSGTGTLELHLLAVPQGGFAYIQIDGDPIGQIVDLTTLGVGELISILGAIDEVLNFLFEGDIVAEKIIEIDIDQPGEHTIDVTFLPKIDLEVLFGFGGGIRSASFCGFDIEVSELFPMLRQAPYNDCWLEQSIDGGQTWTLAFDYSLCQPSANVYDQLFIEFNIENQFNQLEGLYDDQNDPASVAPDLVYGDDDDGNRDIAICWATLMWAELAAQTAIKVIDDHSSLANAVSLALLVVAAIVSVATFGAGGFLLAAAAIAFAGARISETVPISQQWLDGYTTDIFQDSAALRIVACCMSDALKGDTPTRQRFQDSLSTCNFVSTPGFIRQAFEPLLSDIDVYLSWLKLVERGLALAKQELIACECGVNLEVTIGFDETDDLGTVTYAPILAPSHGTTDPEDTLPVVSSEATYSGSLGLKSGGLKYSSHDDGRHCSVEIDFVSDVSVVAVLWRWRCSPLIGSPSSLTHVLTCLDDVGGIVDQQVRVNALNGSWQLEEFALVTEGVRKITIETSYVTNRQPNPIHLDQIRISAIE